MKKSLILSRRSVMAASVADGGGVTPALPATPYAFYDAQAEARADGVGGDLTDTSGNGFHLPPNNGGLLVGTHAILNGKRGYYKTGYGQPPYNNNQGAPAGWSLGPPYTLVFILALPVDNTGNMNTLTGLSELQSGQTPPVVQRSAGEYSAWQMSGTGGSGGVTDLYELKTTFGRAQLLVVEVLSGNDKVMLDDQLVYGGGATGAGIGDTPFTKWSLGYHSTSLGLGARIGLVAWYARQLSDPEKAGLLAWAAQEYDVDDSPKPTRISSSAEASGAGSVSPAIPGDWTLGRRAFAHIVTTDAAATITPPAGWDLVNEDTYGAMKQAIYTRPLTGSESGSLTWSVSSGSIKLVYSTYRNCGAPVSATVVKAATTVVAPALTVTEDGQGYVAFACRNTGNAFIAQQIPPGREIYDYTTVGRTAALYDWPRGKTVGQQYPGIHISSHFGSAGDPCMVAGMLLPSAA